MATTIPAAAVQAVTMRLQEIITTATVERDRRAPVNVDSDPLPCLVVGVDGLEADTSQEPGYTHYRMEIWVLGYAAGTEDTGAALAIYDLHAQVVAALAGWTPDTAGLGDLGEISAEFTLFDADQAETPAGEFTARFSMLAHAPTGNPYL